ncbi:LacI family DNA-binding transcriptional regulator [Streptacidiphilus sp. ASG 303]|uniref:LacI family DNA-binding transcriptional regulator n=1 Tax=Streptomycetaceae TaxID=2062 RepID=UPI001E53FC6C|nr:LacI family DNA-binding transcriptional regulator [Streptacidiphilus sp. ASG 303]MCD0483795.1 LacI family transcriptional regulator [Streptacidiphilus sp. ASG 303]
MKDVAARAGVALKTVSRVVNGEPGVTADTAERVQDAITALGFRRNDSARILRKGRTASVGLVLEDIADPFSSALSRAVEEVARLHGSLLFTGSSDEDPAREEELALAFCARRVDGLVVVPAAGADHRYLAPEVHAGIAAVFVDRPPAGLEADTVLTANAAGARAGTAHLIRQGHRRIAFLGDSPGIHTAEERLRGYREAMAEAGLPVDPSWVSMGPTGPDRVGAALAAALAGPAPATALLTGNNRATLAAVRRLRALDRPVALVGFDDLEFADLLSPGLTVVAQDPAGLGRAAARLLFSRLEGETGPARLVELPTRLVVRGSGEVPPA